MIYLSRNGFWIKSNRIEFDCIWFCSIGLINNWTQRKMDVRLGLITESNQMIGVWLGLIEFCFNFVQLDTPALLIKWRFHCINLVNLLASRIMLHGWSWIVPQIPTNLDCEITFYFSDKSRPQNHYLNLRLKNNTCFRTMSDHES